MTSQWPVRVIGAGQHHDQDVERTGDRTAAEEESGLLHTGAGRLQDRCDRNSARVGESIEVDHLLAKGDDEGQAENSAGDAGEDHEADVELGEYGELSFGVAIRCGEDEQGGNGEHHAGRGSVDGRRDRLVDVVLDDAGAAEDSAEDPPAENCCQFRPFDRETKDQRCISDRDGNQAPQKPTHQDCGPGQFGIGGRAGSDDVDCSKPTEDLPAGFVEGDRKGIVWSRGASIKPWVY